MLLGFVLCLLPAARAAELPGGGVTVPRPDLPALEAEVVLPWSVVRLRPAAPEAPAVGPELLAVGSDGQWAVWDPVARVVLGAGFSVAVPHADGLVYTEDGDLLVLDDGARTLARYAVVGGAAASLARVAIPGLSPVGATLEIEDNLAVGRDVFGNLHPLADLAGGGLDPAAGSQLLPAAHRARVEAGRLSVDGVEIGVSGVVGARTVGEWVVVESGARGAITRRTAVSLVTGRQVALPIRVGAPYRPVADVSVGPDGALAFLDPKTDGLHIVRVSP